MSSQKKSYVAVQLITPIFRMSYPSLIEARAFNNRGTKRFGVEALINPDDMAKFKRVNEGGDGFTDVDVSQVCVEVAKEKWPGINMKDAFVPGKNWPVVSGDSKNAKRTSEGKNEVEHYAGIRVMNFSTSNDEKPPRLYARVDGKRVLLRRDNEADMKRAASLFNGGSYAMAEVSVAAIETPQGKFIKPYLNSIVFVKEGPRLGAPTLMDRYDGIYGGEADVDPFAVTGDDEIPF